MTSVMESQKQHLDRIVEQWLAGEIDMDEAELLVQVNFLWPYVTPEITRKLTGGILGQ